MGKETLLRQLPSVDEVLKGHYGLEWLKHYPKRYILRAVRDLLAVKREAILKGDQPDTGIEVLAIEIEMKLKTLSSMKLREVINATGVVIHTNLGRAPLAEKVIDNIVSVARGYSNLEYSLDRGRRGRRHDHVEAIIRDITGAEDAIAVNNNAAAVLLCLSALAKGKEVIVSRGELVEIGGSFRIPDVMADSGAILREVGTTNKTHLSDYEKGIDVDTGLLLKIHQSNYKIVGFTEEVSIEELVSLGKSRGVPVIFDLGSGCLIDLSPYGIEGEPTVQEVLKSGVDIVTFSGDKLLGGPQAGIIAGKKSFIERIASHPLARAVRIDKLTLSALEATFMEYADSENAIENIPTLSALLQREGEVKRRADKILRLLRKNVRNIEAVVESDKSHVGGGSLPETYLPTYVVAIQSEDVPTSSIEERLRQAQIPVIARIREDRVILDARTVRNSEVNALVTSVQDALASGAY